MPTIVRPIKVLVADDHPVIRQGMAYLFSQYANIELVGLASNGREVITIIKEQGPDVVILDIKMPELDGLRTCQLIKHTYPPIQVIAFSMFDDEVSITSMRTAGVSGYLLKDSNAEEILQAIQAVNAGGEYYCKAIRGRISHLFKSGKLGPAESEKKSNYGEVELSIIRLICEELTSKEIADNLKMSPRTIEHYKERIQEKMGVHSSVGIALYAMNNWLLKSLIGLICLGLEL